MNDETEFLEIVAGIISRESGRPFYTMHDWLEAEHLLSEIE